MAVLALVTRAILLKNDRTKECHDLRDQKCTKSTDRSVTVHAKQKAL